MTFAASEPYLVCLWLTVKIAGIATMAIVPVGTALGFLLQRPWLRGKVVIESLLLLPMSLPPVAVGLGLMYVLAPDQWLGRIWELWTGDRLLLSGAAAVAAAFVVALPLQVKAAREAFASVPPQLEQVALSLGLKPLQILWTVSLPLARPGLRSGALLAFARALGEFGATSLVAGSIAGRTETLALAIYNSINSGREQQAWILAAMSAALAFIAVFASQLRQPLHR